MVKRNNVSAPAKLLKNSSSSKPKSAFHTAIYNIEKILNNYELEKDKKKIDNLFKSKFSKNEKLIPDNVLLNNIYRKPMRKFIITVVFTIIDVPIGAKTGALHPTYSIKK